MILHHSGLPIIMDEQTGELSFYDGLLHDGNSAKTLDAMQGLFKLNEITDSKTIAYRAYRNIRFAGDEQYFEKSGLSYDMTVVLPGTVGDEYFKTSGHYHSYAAGDSAPYPEVYEVIAGEIIFVLQKSKRFDQDDPGRFEYIRAIRVKAGEAIIIPPFCGHCSINPLNTVSAFSNIAATACSNSYDPIQRAHGLAAYVLHDGGEIRLEANRTYGEQPAPALFYPIENPGLGIEFGYPCYTNYIRHPERYAYMLQPSKFVDRIDAMMRCAV
ncbi:hypothetical protein K6V98_04750 [Collinsella sp. AGMB00827]|uniref:glucose-6-phosphate isomerase n=1 Tax=Collinsella ureilytica TaxID=2869515 RepID=A0ABS7MJX4_9ACTN|nr:glucose-6-phosphate isomerase family protein [Collinsella urealyticum]MBY4797664.1 hypothetical protein [Collinsella urealyticum]